MYLLRTSFAQLTDVLRVFCSVFTLPLYMLYHNTKVHHFLFVVDVAYITSNMLGDTRLIFCVILMSSLR